MSRSMFFLFTLVIGTKGNLIQRFVSQVKSLPGHKSSSPSYNGERQFEVIGTGKLPLQSERRISGVERSPVLEDVITGGIVRFETSGDNAVDSETDATDKVSTDLLIESDAIEELSETEEDILLSQGSHSLLSIPPRHRQRQRNPHKKFAGPPIRGIVNQFFNNDRRTKRKQENRRKRPSVNIYEYDRKELEEEEDEEGFHNFFGGHNRPRPNKKNYPPRVNGFKRFKRKPGNLRRPLKQRSRGKFKPPHKIFQGFTPTFKGSANYDQDDEDFPGRLRKHNEHHHQIDHLPETPKRRKPHHQLSHHVPSFIEDNSFFEDSDRFPGENLIAGGELPSLNVNHLSQPESVLSEDPRILDSSHQDQTDILPFIEEIQSFGAEPDPLSDFRPDRPKRQRPRPSADDLLDHEFGLEEPENSFKDANDDNLGFFSDAQENFPDIESFGIGWDPQKVRRKREALENPFYYKPAPRRPRRGQRPRQAIQHTNRRQSPGGFWDDADFDAEFFNGGSPQPFRPFEGFDREPENPFKTHFSPPLGRPKGHRTARRPKITPKKFKPGGYASYNQLQTLETNSILGSGNFDILKGGTFYDEHDYPRQYSNNHPPEHYNYYGNNDIFSNFRDFADIKGDTINNGYQEGFYYR